MKLEGTVYVRGEFPFRVKIAATPIPVTLGNWRTIGIGGLALGPQGNYTAVVEIMRTIPDELVKLHPYFTVAMRPVDHLMVIIGLGLAATGPDAKKWEEVHD